MWATTIEIQTKMRENDAGLILRVASERRDAQNERDRAGVCSDSSDSVAAATPSQLRCSSTTT